MRIDWSLESWPVSVVIVTDQRRQRIQGVECYPIERVLESLLSDAGGRPIELVVAVADKVSAAFQGAIEFAVANSGANVATTFVVEPQMSKPELRNIATLTTTSERLVFLRDHIWPTGPDFLGRLTAPLVDRTAGLVGCRTYTRAGVLVDAGLAVHSREGLVVTQVMAGCESYDPGKFNALVVDHEVSALSDACVAMTRTTFDSVGGWCETIPDELSGIDMSFKVRQSGNRVIWLSWLSCMDSRDNHVQPKLGKTVQSQFLDMWDPPRVDPFFPGW